MQVVFISLKQADKTDQMPMLIFKSIGNITNYLYRNICPSFSILRVLDVRPSATECIGCYVRGAHDRSYNVVAVATCFFGILMINFTQQLKGRFERVEGTNSHWSGPAREKRLFKFFFIIYFYISLDSYCLR